MPRPDPPTPPAPPLPSAAGGDVQTHTTVETVRMTVSPSGTVTAARETTGGLSPAATPFQNQTLFEAAVGLNSLEIDDEIVVSDLLGDKHFRLNPTASVIWRLILRTASLGEIGGELAQRFQLTPEKAQEAAVGFLQDLIKKGFVVRSTV